MPYAKNKGAEQRSLISTFVVRCLDSIILMLANSKISRLQLVSVTAQTGLSLTWSQTPKTGFLMVWFPKYSDTPKICCNHSKIWTMWLYHRVMSPNDADGMANSVDPDQTAPLGAVWSGSALFAQAYLSENLGSLRYTLQVGQNFIVHHWFHKNDWWLTNYK